MAIGLNRMKLFGERKPLAGIPGSSRRGEVRTCVRPVVWTLSIGVYLVLNTLFLSQGDLQTPATPVHVSLLVILGGWALASRDRGESVIPFYAMAGLGLLVSLASCLSHANPFVLGAGWVAVLAAVIWWEFRGGAR